MGWALDLDGVMWRGDRPIAGSAEAVATLRAAGETVVFVTNNSSSPVVRVEQKLADMGVDAVGAVLTSAQAAARLVSPGARALVCGGEGIVEALRGRGVEVVEPSPDRRGGGAVDVDVVVVGFTRAFDFDLLAVASSAVRAGAQLIGTNEDATYPTPDGELPGGGALLAAVATAGGATPLVAGKPHPPMVEMVGEMLGGAGTMVGDRPSTDGVFARALGFRFGLVRSGVTPQGASVSDPVPDFDALDLGSMVGSLVP